MAGGAFGEIHQRYKGYSFTAFDGIFCIFSAGGSSAMTCNSV